jgi:hypothetical protein
MTDHPSPNGPEASGEAVAVAVTADGLPAVHVLVHVREALATDGRVGELGLDLDDHPAETGLRHEGVVVVRGVVSTVERKAGIVPLVLEVLAAHGLHHAVRDETEVARATVPDGGAEAL